MSQSRKWAAPRVFPVKVLPTKPVMDWVQSLANRHFSGDDEVYDDEAELALPVYPFCASIGAVRPHTDNIDGNVAGMLVYGWILRSDGHRVHTADFPEGLLLTAGDLYCIDPLVRHWTTCPSSESQLIFAVAITPPDHRTPKKLAQDFRMNAIVACIEHERQQNQVRLDELTSLRGVGR